MTLIKKQFLDLFFLLPYFLMCSIWLIVVIIFTIATIMLHFFILLLSWIIKKL